MFNKVGLDDYFQLLPPWGIHPQRSYELMTTIKEDVKAKNIIGTDGEELQVKIIKDLISKAVKLPHCNKAIKILYQLNHLDRKAIFLNALGKHETFKDLVYEDISLPSSETL